MKKTLEIKTVKSKEKTISCELCGKEAHQIHHKDLNHKNDVKENLQNLCTLCHASIHGIDPKKSELKTLVIMRDRAIQIRNSLNNQVRGFSRIEVLVPNHWETEQKEWDKKIKEYEKQIKLQFKNGNYPAFVWLKSVKGIGDVTAAKLISYIDIQKTPTISALWRYCGLDATRIKRTKNCSQEIAKEYGNPYLKKELIGILADSFIKQRTPIYRQIYDDEKTRQLKLLNSNHILSENQESEVNHFIHENQKYFVNQNGNEIQKCTVSIPKNRMHCHLRAKRKMVKLFLSHFWTVWRKAENLTVTQPYAQAILGHQNIIEPVLI